MREITQRKSSSWQGIVKPMLWLKPYSSSARWSKHWNSWWPSHDIGTTYLLRFSPTYTTKWPFGTACDFFPMLEYFLRICLRFAVCLFDFIKAIIAKTKYGFERERERWGWIEAKGGGEGLILGEEMYLWGNNNNNKNNNK